MKEKILIAYAGKYGSTKEIADKVGSVLRQAGVEAEVLPAQQVPDLNPYRAVILGSAVYAGFWRKEAVRFLKTHESALAKKAVWLFSSGPTGKGDANSLLKGWRFPKGQQPIADRIRPRDIAVFHGNLDAGKLNFFEKWIIGRVKAPIGDFRDWDAIASWSKSIASALK